MADSAAKQKLTSNDEILAAELERDEGTVLHVYPDHLGYMTLGTGRLVDERRGGGVSKEEARYLLLNDIDRVQKQLDAAIPWWRGLDPVRARVIQNLCFNLGINGLLGFKNTLAAVKAHEWEQASAGLLASKWATQVGARAQRLAKMMRTGSP